MVFFLQRQKMRKEGRKKIIQKKEKRERENKNTHTKVVGALSYERDICECGDIYCGEICMRAFRGEGAFCGYGCIYQ